MSGLDNNARISLVMLTHNELSETKKCLDSVLAMLPDPLFAELIILDNGSLEATREYISSLSGYAKVRVSCSIENLGVALGRQWLFAEAQGDIVASLDSDVAIEGTVFFHKVRELLTGNPRVGICGISGYRVHFVSGQLGLEPVERDGFVDCVSGFCQVFPRELLRHVHIDTAFSPFWCEDTDFCFQAKSLGYRVYRLSPELGLRHHYRSANVRVGDPRKLAHEALLVQKWSGRINLMGERPWPRLRRCLKRARNDFACRCSRMLNRRP